MKTELVRIGNSRGIRIPKPIIEQCRLGDTVERVSKKIAWSYLWSVCHGRAGTRPSAQQVRRKAISSCSSRFLPTSLTARNGSGSRIASAG